MKAEGHILTWVLFSLSLMAQIWLQSSISGLLILCAVILLMGLILGQGMVVLRQIRWMAVFLLLFTSIQLVIRQDGLHVIWSYQTVLSLAGFEWIFQFRLTMETLKETFISAIRFFMFALVFLTISPLIPGKRLLSYTSNWFPHGAQMMYLTLRLVPFLKYRGVQLQNILQTRGFQPELKRGWKETIRIRLPFLEALLEETLEGAWHRAESMIARGYGKTKRTQYRSERWSLFDSFVIFILFISFYFVNIPFVLFINLLPVLFYVIFNKNSSFHDWGRFRL